MSYVEGEDRHQAALLPAAIEDYVAADAPVRVIDAFVDRLNVSELGLADRYRPQRDGLLMSCGIF
jgi:transposase